MLAALAALALATCSVALHQETLGRKHVRSDTRQKLSLTASGEMFFEEIMNATVSNSRSVMVADNGVDVIVDFDNSVDLVRDNGVDVTVYGTYGRMGNNGYGLLNVLVFAEARGRRRVVFSSQGYKYKLSLSQILELPDEFSIDENSELQSRVQCVDSWDANAMLHGWPCKGVRRHDLRRAAAKYLKPLLNSATKTACESEGDGFSGLTIHLRSGDLLANLGENCMGLWLPCAFHDLAIAAGNFNRIRIVTESDMAHPCLPVIRSRHADKQIIVQSKSVQEDACALMTAQHLEHPFSTFANFLDIMNENVKDVAMASRPGPCHYWGDNLEQFAQNHCNSQSDRAIQYTIYSADGSDILRDHQAMNDYLVNTPASAFHTKQACEEHPRV